jgi:hypothetical protein
VCAEEKKSDLVSRAASDLHKLNVYMKIIRLYIEVCLVRGMIAQWNAKQIFDYVGRRIRHGADLLHPCLAFDTPVGGQSYPLGVQIVPGKCQSVRR